MKRLLLSAALMFSAMPAYADGLSEQGLADPVVTPPARVSGGWTGFYVGLTYGRNSTSTEGQRCFKLGQPKACDDPIFDYYPEYKEVETFSIASEEDQIGAFVGYRHDFGLLVGGIEVGAFGDRTTAEAQIGADLGKALIYGLVGTGNLGDRTGVIYGAGIDVKVGKRLLIGVKHTTDMTTARIGIQF